MDITIEYRPSALSEIIGHEATVKSLTKAIKTKKLQHTILFHGNAGTGKTTFARVIANEIHCPESNIIEVDGGTDRGIAFVKELKDNLSCSNFGNPLKFVIIDECHSLTNDAWQGLLKITEEPPDYVYFVFCTTEFSKIPETIKRRCAKFSLKPLDRELIKSYIITLSKKENCILDEDVIDLIVERSNGSIGIALGFLNTIRFLETYEEVAEILEEPQSKKDVIEIAKAIVSQKLFSQVQPLLKELKGNIQPENARIIICNYLSACLLNAKKYDVERFTYYLNIFSEPIYIVATGFASLVLKISQCMIKE